MSTTSTLDSLKQDVNNGFDAANIVMERKLSTVEKRIEDLQSSSISQSQADTMQDTLCLILQHLQLDPANTASQRSRILGEVDNDDPWNNQALSKRKERQTVNVDANEQRIFDSIRRLS